MLLTIDVGNTHTVLGLFDGEDIVEHWRISTDARRTADELAVLMQGLMGMHPLLGDELGDGIDGIAICATVPSVTASPTGKSSAAARSGSTSWSCRPRCWSSSS